MGFNSFYYSAADTIKRNWPKISIYSGIGGFISTTVLAVSETPEALRRIEEKKKKENTDKLTVGQTIQAAWKCYIPSAMTGILSTTLIACGDAGHTKRNAALSTACVISENALRSFRKKTAEIVGEKKEKEIHDAVLRERIDKMKTTNDIVIADSTKVICYDTVFGRKFLTTYEDLRNAERRINQRLFDEMYVSLNDFYDELDLAPTKIGYEVGWKLEKGALELYISTQFAEDGRTPCYALDYNITPNYNFNKFS